MNAVRLFPVAVVVLLLAGTLLTSGVAAQQGGFACEDFLTQTAAQTYLEDYPADPYGLDPDGDGVACEDMLAEGAPGSGVATDAIIGEAERLPLDARLGGTVESWQAAFGLPVEREGEAADLFTEYDIPDLGTVYADEHLGRIEGITLFAPRPDGEEWADESHEMNWTVDEAHEIAEAFLPRDAQTDATLNEEAFGFVHTLGSSESLAAEVPRELYDYVDDTPQYGRYSYALWYANYEAGDEISWITIGLEIDEPPDTDGGTDASVDAPQNASDAAQGGFEAEERAYVAELERIMLPVSEGLIRVGELFQDPRPADEDWVFEVALQFVLWESSYQEMLALDPPPEFAEIHGLYVESLRLIVDASDDIAVGMDTGDAARLDQAAPKFEQANGLIDLANVLIEELVAERSG